MTLDSAATAALHDFDDTSIITVFIIQCVPRLTGARRGVSVTVRRSHLDTLDVQRQGSLRLTRGLYEIFGANSRKKRMLNSMLFNNRTIYHTGVVEWTFVTSRLLSSFSACGVNPVETIGAQMNRKLAR